MIYSLFNSVRWLVSVGKKFFKVAPGHTLLVIITTLVSQLALIVAFFLPLKVLILLGSNGMPRYFPESWKAFDRSELAVALSLSAVGFYILYLLSDKIVSYFSRNGAFLLVSKTKKTTLFEGQDVVAIDSYSRFSRGLAGIVFFTLSLSSAAFFYLDLSLVIFTYIFVVMFIFTIFQKFLGPDQLNWDHLLSPVTVIGSAIGFLLVFSYMVGDFILGSPPNMIVAIVCILISRQSLNKLGTSLVDFYWLYVRKDKISALFFHGQRFLPAETKKQNQFQLLVDSNQRNLWIKTILEDIKGSQIGLINSYWLQTRLPHVSSVVASTSGKGARSFLLKLYNTNRRGLGKHEGSLVISSEIQPSPSFKYLGSRDVEGFCCNVFEFESGWVSVPKPRLMRARISLSATLMSICPDPGLSQIYKRSHPLLNERLNHLLIQRLTGVLGKDRANQLYKLEFALPLIQSRLASLPYQIVNPHAKLDMIFENNSGLFKYLHWGAWQIEPVGAGWPVKDTIVQSLDTKWPAIQEIRQELVPVSKYDVMLSALIYQFEFFYFRQLYSSAIELIPEISRCLDAAQKEIEDGKV